MHTYYTCLTNSPDVLTEHWNRRLEENSSNIELDYLNVTDNHGLSRPLSTLGHCYSKYRQHSALDLALNAHSEICIHQYYR